MYYRRWRIAAKAWFAPPYPTLEKLDQEDFSDYSYPTYAVASNIL
ncbi:MAG: hypothetical protein PX483_21715 [Nostocales cyanobacterium LE14-WE4]|jgi:hypothetical protein|nr:hypothetical protein [Nostocales cyanobacterium LE14-WE4]